MKTIEYRKFEGVETCRHQVGLNIGRLTLALAFLSNYVGPLKLFKIAGHDGYRGARWSYCFWFHRVGLGVGWDFIGLGRL